MATYSIPLGASGDALELRVNPFSGNRLFHNGQRVRRKFLANKFNVQAGDGQTYEVMLRSRYIDVLPKALVNGQEVKYAEPLATWMYVISGTALLLVLVSIIFAGGVFTALVAALAFYFGQTAMRGMENTALAGIIALALSGLAWLIWIVFVVAVLALLS